jgi:HEAT repeat protein
MTKKVTTDKKSLIIELKDNNFEIRYQAASKLRKEKCVEAIPELIEALSDKSSAVSCSAIIALGDLAHSKAVPALIKVFLSDKDWQVRETAIKILGYIADPEAVPALIIALQDEHESVRRSATIALDALANSLLVEDLTNILKDKNKLIPISESDKLNLERDKTELAKLIKDLEHGDKKTKLYAVEVLSHIALGKTPFPEMILPLLNVLENEDGEISLYASEAIANITKRYKAIDPKWVSAIIDKLNSKDQSSHINLLETLGNIADPKTVPVLKKFLKDANTYIRKAARNAMSKIASPQTIPILIQVLTDKSETLELRLLAAEMLGKIADPKTTQTLIEALEQVQKDDYKASLQKAIIVALGEIKDPKATPVLIAALKKQYKKLKKKKPTDVLAQWELELFYEEICQEIIATLGKIASPEAIPYLIEALKHSNKNIRQFAAIALGNIKAREALPYLINALQDSNKNVKFSAVQALAKIADPSSREALIKVLQEDDYSLDAIQNAMTQVEHSLNPEIMPHLKSTLEKCADLVCKNVNITLSTITSAKQLNY